MTAVRPAEQKREIEKSAKGLRVTKKTYLLMCLQYLMSLLMPLLEPGLRWGQRLSMLRWLTQSFLTHLAFILTR
jgi:hypothetical protein